MRVYLDNCCLNRPFDDQGQIRIKIETEAKIFVQMLIVEEKLELAWSYMINHENSANPVQDRREVVSRWRARAAVDQEETPEVIAEALALRERGLKAKDALHVACAVVSGCQWFLSTDDAILRKLETFDKIRVANPVSFVYALEVAQ